ncbi:MAG TPA: DoxX family protein [bacterium]|nr:DoxX family protein [bacterium]
MKDTNKSATGSKAAFWTGRVLSTICVLFLIFDGVTKVLQDPHVTQALAQGGYQPGVAVPLGITVLLCTLLYVIPKTSVLGALLLTAWLGGAVDSMVRMNMPGHPYLFPVAFGVLVWLGLYLREERLKALLPFRS